MGSFQYIKNTTRLLFVLSFLLIGCRKDYNFKVEGHFRVPDQTPVRLYVLQQKTAKLVDSVKLNEGNSFILKGFVEQPSIYMLKFFNNQSIFLVIKQNDKLKIDIDNSAPEIYYYVEGSYDSKLVKELVDKQNFVLKQIDQLSKEFEENYRDSLTRRRVDTAYAKLLKKHKEYTIDFINKNPNSLANILALYQNFGKKSQPLFNKYEDLNVFNFVDSNLVKIYPGSEPVKALDREVAEIKDQIAQKKYLENTVVEGRPIPRYSGKTVSNDSIAINPDNGKAYLLYFWASWNPYSVEELKTVDSLFKVYGSKELSIITISLDPSKEKLNSFLTTDSIKEPVICDYKYWDSEIAAIYSIKRIPSVILTNSDGIIIAKDLFSNELIHRVALNIKGKLR
jgi:thiol-disulfide isomerase/thioredoxin